MDSGIYKITNNKNGKVYIGQAKNIRRRIYRHKSKLRLNKHENRHLQNAWNVYGESAFTFEIVELCSIAVLGIRERHWIISSKSISREFGYNHDLPIGDGGKQLSEETKRKIAAAKIGNRYGVGNKGRSGIQCSPETRAKMSASISQRMKTPLTKQTLAIAGKKRRRQVWFYCEETGEIELALGLVAFAEAKGINRGNISSVANGVLTQTAGWRLATKQEVAAHLTATKS